MSPRAEIFLGVIALATLTMAIGMVGVVVAASRLANQFARFLDQLESDLKPLLGHLNAIARDASRAAALATAQVERVDRLVTDLGQRLDDTFQSVQDTIAGPARHGFAVISALGAALRALRNPRAGRARGEEEDALFI